MLAFLQRDSIRLRRIGKKVKAREGTQLRPSKVQPEARPHQLPLVRQAQGEGGGEHRERTLALVPKASVRDKEWQGETDIFHHCLSVVSACHRLSAPRFSSW